MEDLSKHKHISKAVKRHWLIYQHWQGLVASGERPYIAALDCAIHFGVSERTVYRALERFRS